MTIAATRTTLTSLITNPSFDILRSEERDTSKDAPLAERADRQRLDWTKRIQSRHAGRADERPGLSNGRAPIRDCVGAIEQECAANPGARRFEALRKTLRDRSPWLGKLGGRAGRRPAVRILDRYKP